MAASKFTSTNRAAVVERIAGGATVVEAARGAGIRPATLKGWLTRGRRDREGPYCAFAAAVAEARERIRDARATELTDEEFEQHLARAVRAGHVQAMKLWSDRQRERRGGDGSGAVVIEIPR